MQEFRKFLEFLDEILQFSAKFWEFEAFSSIFAKFRQNFITIWPKNGQFQMKNRKIWMKMNKFIFIFAKKLDDFSLKFWYLSGAKAHKSCRSEKMLKNAPTLAIGGVHTAENEPPRNFIISFHYFNPILTLGAPLGLTDAGWMLELGPVPSR